MAGLPPPPRNCPKRTKSLKIGLLGLAPVFREKREGTRIHPCAILAGTAPLEVVGSNPTSRYQEVEGHGLEGVPFLYRLL